MRYFIKLAYNGTAYHGWQIQPNAITVQETLENALSKLLKSTISIVGAGRTDTGVHAIEMFAHFNVNQELNTKQLIYKLNAFLPKDISVENIYKVNPDLHARFDAVSRSYLYRIAIQKNPFNIDQAYYFKHHLDVDKMNEAAAILLEYEDFECFSKVHTQVKTFICNITEANWTYVNNELHFTITANRFLRNMVRAIVGTLITIGLKKINVNDLHAILASKNRSEAGYSVPAHGLYLTKIVYPKNSFINE